MTVTVLAQDGVLATTAVLVHQWPRPQVVPAAPSARTAMTMTPIRWSSTTRVVLQAAATRRTSGAYISAPAAVAMRIADAAEERDADAEQAEHEEPVDEGVAGRSS